MKLRKVKYHLMTSKALNDKLDKLIDEMNSEVDPYKRMALLGEMTDIITVVIYKSRNDKEFMQFVHDTLDDLITEGVLD